jgi:hypothetical protein
MANERTEKVKKMTLRSYYQSLPDASYPKTSFINEVVKETGVSAPTVRNWINYGMRPSKQEYVDVLVRLTGIEESELWERK